METSQPQPAPAVVPAKPKLRTARGRVYEPAIGPRLKVFLAVIFAAVALLGATGAYLLAITVLEKARGLTYTNQFTLGMFMAHVVLGVLFVLPFLAFGIRHWSTAYDRPNREAVRLGIALFLTGIIVCLTGLALIQLEKLPQLPTGTFTRTIVYALHLIAPVVAVVLYVLHRRAGPEIRWRWGVAWGGGVGVFIVAMAAMHTQDPRRWYARGPEEGEQYFLPSRVRTADGNFIPAEALMMDDYCMKCHQDIGKGWFHSAHHFSSFNNPPYLFSVRETRKVSMERVGNVKASRWCAGCHDVVPFLSGAFSNPNYDDVNDPTAHAGITCTSCHAITNINSTVGNSDYTIEEPQHYPFAYSKNWFLQWLNNQVVKARPDFHKKTFLKPFHKTAEFCATCHKVSIPGELNFYKEFLRGQNHYDTYLLSGVSGVGARSFYYPAQAKTNCAECHMPLKPSDTDFGRKDFDGSGQRKIHDHLFPDVNTGLMDLLSKEPARQDHAEAFRQAIQAHRDFLRGTDLEGKDKKLRIDLFALKEGGTIDGRLLGPLRPELPRLKPGATYLVEVVIRTLNMGHPFPQGTSDSNEIWVDFKAKAGDRVIGRSGALSGTGEAGKVDEWSHFVNVLMLDRHGNRINRRNPQDIFTPLYDHQIPPGAAQVVHYALKVPEDVKAPVELSVRLRYRKFDYEYMSLVYKDAGRVPELPIVDICEDSVILPVDGLTGAVGAQESLIHPAWQRWNDYGIGCFLEGGQGSKKGELRQAEEAFQHLVTLPDADAHGHGYLNLARVFLDEGRLREAVDVLRKSQEVKPPAPWWTAAWFTGLVDAQNGYLDEAIASFEKILDPKNQLHERKFDFTRDYVVINELANTLFRRAQQEDEPAARDRYLRRAVELFERTLALDAEDLDAHYGLAQCFARLGEEAPAATGSSDTVPIDEAGVRRLADTLADGTVSPDRRLQAAADLCVAVVRYGQAPTQADRPKLPTLLKAISRCREVYGTVGNEGLRAAAARALGCLYRQTHAIYKPDDNAKDRAVRIYRENHRAAAEASQAIVIYPLHQRADGAAAGQ
jgi:tetratricopeptide (TPR) repeat protein